MTLSELITQLEALKKEHGDIDVVVQSLSHIWAPDPEPRYPDFDRTKKVTHILLNP